MRTVLAWLLVLFALPAVADELTIVAPGFWCPYSCDAAAKDKGFTIDMIAAIFSRHGDHVRYINMNYSRALLEVRSGKATATPASYKSEAPDFVFPELPISSSRYCFYTARDRAWSYHGVESLAGQRIGIIQGYLAGQPQGASLRASL